MDECLNLQFELKKVMLENDLKGTILLGENEGINSTIAGSRQGIDNFYAFVGSHLLIFDLKFKESFYNSNPFDKIKVKIKKEIVTLKKGDTCWLNKRGKYVKTQDWDDFISLPDVVILDTRNDYEFNIGTFKNAINPNIKSFKELPQWFDDNRNLYKGKKLATFCTGGIRCEKLTAYILEFFPEVYHLDGGILQYFEDTKNKNNMWIGNCFVFDNRIAVNPSLEAV